MKLIKLILASLFLPFVVFASSVAVTMDDPHAINAYGLSAKQINEKILSALKKHSNLKAGLFVCGKRIDSDEAKALLSSWDNAGHTIGNHSFSHLYYNSPKVDFEQYKEDFLKGEQVIEKYSHFEKYFRFPYLKEGESKEKRDKMRALLKEKGYKNGYVTIDASDWYIDGKLTEKLRKNPDADVKPYRDFYLKHIWDRANYYNNLSKKVLGREAKHTLLVHYNLLNALFLDDLLTMFEKKGWKLIDVAEAYKDPIHTEKPTVLPAGESIIWSIAKKNKKYSSGLRYPGEDWTYEKGEMEKLNL
ncbi:MAG: polysaccharide deacetylase family protein [Bacteriovoracia bacterium]